MNSDYTRLNDYYRNQNNYIPTRYYCEKFASAEIAYFDVYVTDDGTKVRIDAPLISTSTILKFPVFGQFEFIADKIQADIKSFDVFIWKQESAPDKPAQGRFIPNVFSMATSNAISLTKNKYYNQIKVGRDSTSIVTALGAISPFSTARQPKATAQAPTQAREPPLEYLIARIYITY